MRKLSITVQLVNINGALGGWLNPARVKAMAATTIFLCALAAPVLTRAVDKETPASQPAQSQTGNIPPGQTQRLPAQQIKRQDHLRGELILKFTDEAVIGAVADELVRGRQLFREVTGDSNLDRLNRQYQVKAMRKVFGREVAGTAPGRLDRQSTELRHRQLREKFKNEVAAMRGKRLKKKGLAAAAASGQREIPYLEPVYRVEVAPETDIDLACAEYARDPNVAYCQPNFRMAAQWEPNDPYYGAFSSWGQGYDDLWGLKKLQTAEAWEVTRGAGVVVAVVDSGVDYGHVDLAANIWTNGNEIPGNGIDDDNNGYVDDVRGWDFYNNDNDPQDGHGHGTHVSGTIAAVGDNATGIVGVAPSAKIMAVKGLSDSGSGSSSGLAAAIRYAANNEADVINNSWGCSSPCGSNPVAEDAVAYAHGLGAVVVFAAGNSHGDVTLYSPQNQSNNVITVASSSELDTRSIFSNIGSLIDVAAPGGGSDGSSTNRVGRNILSLRAGSTDMYNDGLCIVGANYYRARGTSMAAPHVAGVAALVLAAHPAFTPEDVSQALRISADDIEATGFDLLSGTGRVNAQRAVAVPSVPRVRIDSPLKSINVTKPSTVTIRGDAAGPNFAKYRLFYAPLDKAPDQALYTPTLGTWQPLGAESTQAVTDGVLATFNSNLFAAGQSYLFKLEVTTTSNAVFTDLKEILFYQEDPRFYILATGDLSSARGPHSDGDRFAWIEAEPPQGEGGAKRYVGKVYDGATNRLVTIYPDQDKANAWVDRLLLNSGKIIWYETNYSYGKTSVATLSPTGEVVVEGTVPYRLYSADQGKILLDQGDAPFYGMKVYLYDLATLTLSQQYAMPSGDPSQSGVYLHGTSVVTNMWYPGGVSDDVTVNLTDLATGSTEVVTVVPGEGAVNEAINGPGVVVWRESHNAEDVYPMFVFDKTTKVTTSVTGSAHPSSFATDGQSIIYSAFGSETGEFKLNLYAYDIPTATTSFYASNYVAGATNNMWPSFGTKHIQWWAAPVIMVRNDVPSPGGVNNQAIGVNSLFSLTMNAADPEGDKVDVSAVGGTWPDAASVLPDGATFTDNGNGTGTLRWTPTALGTHTISFLARDFTGRKEGAWNSGKTVTYLVYDANDPQQPLGVTIAGGGTVHSSPIPDINCSGGTCSQAYARDTVVTLNAGPAADYVFSGWSGACSGFATCSVTMDQPRMVTAAFVPSYLLSVTVTGSGTVHSTPTPDINCSAATCSQSYDSATTVTLSAAPAAGFVFNGWSGACSGLGTCVLITNRAQSVTATFLPTYPLNVTISGSGVVHSAPAPDVNCSTGTCSKSYPSGTTATLTASPADGFSFSGWTGDCSGSSTCTVAMDGEKNVAATFTKTSSRLSLSVVGSHGNIHSSPAPDINCTGASCTQWYDVGTVVTLTAAPGTVSYFSSWSGTCSGTSPTCTVTLDQDKSVTAIYQGCGSITSSGCFSYIQAALDNAADGNIIKARGGYLAQSLTTNQATGLFLEGGYDATFTTRSGFSTVPQLTIRNGSLTVSDIAIQ